MAGLSEGLYEGNWEKPVSKTKRYLISKWLQFAGLYGTVGKDFSCGFSFPKYKSLFVNPKGPTYNQDESSSCLLFWMKPVDQENKSD